MTIEPNEWAILLQNPTPPNEQTLTPIYQQIDGLTAYDARAHARTSFGVLVEHLGQNDAITLMGALQREGIACAVVPESALDTARPHYAYDLRPTEECLWIIEGDEEHPIAWQHVKVVAAGLIPDAAEDLTGHEVNTSGLAPREHSTREMAAAAGPMVSVVDVGYTTMDGLQRSVRFQRAVPRPEFIDKVRRMAALAHDAALNRCVAGLATDTDSESLLEYASHSEFGHETRWLMWRVGAPA